MWLGKLVRGYLLMAAGRLLSPAPRQEVLDASLPSVCTSPIALPHLAAVPPGAWRAAVEPTSSIIDISIPLHAATVDWERCAHNRANAGYHKHAHSATGLGPLFRTLDASQQLGDRYTASALRMSAHTGAGRGPTHTGVCESLPLQAHT